MPASNPHRTLPPAISLAEGLALTPDLGLLWHKAVKPRALPASEGQGAEPWHGRLERGLAHSHAIKCQLGEAVRQEAYGSCCVTLGALLALSEPQCHLWKKGLISLGDASFIDRCLQLTLYGQPLWPFSKTGGQAPSTATQGAPAGPHRRQGHSGQIWLQQGDLGPFSVSPAPQSPLPSNGTNSGAHSDPKSFQAQTQPALQALVSFNSNGGCHQVDPDIGQRNSRKRKEKNPNHHGLAVTQEPALPGQGETSVSHTEQRAPWLPAATLRPRLRVAWLWPQAGC